MKRFLTCSLLLLLLITSSAMAQPQQWIQDYIQRVGFQPDSIVNYIHNEMKKEIGKQAPTFLFTPLEKGKSLSLKGFVGQPTIVMLWKTTCSGSRMQLTELEKLQQEYAQKGLEVIYVSPESDSTLKDFQIKHQVSGIIARTKTDQLTQPYQLFATPSAFLMDQSGNIQEVWLRPRKMEVLEKLITPYLE